MDAQSLVAGFHEDVLGRLDQRNVDRSALGASRNVHHYGPYCNVLGVGSQGSQVVVYGAGRVGQVVARAVAASGRPVVLAGRDLHRVQLVASTAGLPFAIASAMCPSELDGLLSEAMAVVNTAGPQAATAPSLIDAAIRNGCHYLDVANEPEALAAAFRCHRLARERGVRIVVGLGLGVAGSEAAAVQALSLLPEARRLEVVFAPSGVASPSTGVVHTMLQTLAHGPYTVVDGRLVRHHPGWGVRRGYLGDAVPTSLVPVFTGDLLALSRSQPVRDVTVYTPVRLPTMSLRIAVPVVSVLLRSSLVRRVAVRSRPEGGGGPQPDGFRGSPEVLRYCDSD